MQRAEDIIAPTAEKNSAAHRNKTKFLILATIVGVALISLVVWLFTTKEDASEFVTTESIPQIERNTSCIERTAAQQAIVDSRDRPLILYYTQFFENKFGTLDEIMYGRYDKNGVSNMSIPECYDCDSTTDRTRFAEASIIVYHLSDTGAQIPQKYCGQYNAMVNYEAPPHFDDLSYTQSLAQERGRSVLSQVDISISYRLDADIPGPHFVTLYEENFASAFYKPIAVPINERNSTMPVAWIARKCETDNDRISYVKELSKYIGVASYGKCFHNADFEGRSDVYDESAAISAAKTVSKHKFYLSFENSNCDYYVTEKLTRTLEIGVIPIIMGAPQTDEYLPNNHTGINVADFKSPKHLAAFLNKINDDDVLFESYLSYKNGDISPEFKDRWITKHRHRVCKLCDIAKNKVPIESLKGMKFDFSCKKQKYNF